jgi:hypothetical protein
VDNGDIAIGAEIKEFVGDGTALFCCRVSDDVWRIEEGPADDGPRRLVEEMGGWAAFYVGRQFQKELERRQFQKELERRRRNIVFT